MNVWSSWSWYVQNKQKAHLVKFSIDIAIFYIGNQIDSQRDKNVFFYLS